MSTFSQLLTWHRKTTPPYLAELFPEQRAFFEDPAKQKAAVCGRRAGKTVVDAAGLFEAASAVPRSMCPYITLSSVMARRIMWPVLVWFNARYSLGMKMNENDLVAQLDNGSSIFLVGGDDARKVEALRGAPYPRVVIDEAGSFPRLLFRYLVDDVLDAALMDYDGDLWITGTPNAACTGYFHDLTTGKNPEVATISTHHWTMLDNIHLPHAKDWLERKRASKKWSLDHPVFQREYMGRWIRDIDSMVFRFIRAKHVVDEIPELIRGGLGVDLGVSDRIASTAMVAAGWARHDKRVFTVRAKKYPSMTPTTSAEEVDVYRADFPWIQRIIADAGGLGKGYVDQWRTRKELPLPAYAAEKQEKLANVELLNADLDDGNLVLLSGACEPLIEELELLQWNDDRDGYDERFADHASDAWLYIWRDCKAFREQAAVVKPAVGTPEHAALIEKQWEERLLGELQRKKLSRATPTERSRLMDEMRRTKMRRLS